MSDQSNSTFRPALLLMSGRAAAFTVTFLIPVFLSRIFTQLEFGTYKQIFLIVYTLYGVGQIGMAESLFYFLPLFPREAGKFVTNSVFMLSLTGLACLTALLAMKDKVAGWLSNPDMASYAGLAGAYLLLMLAGCSLEIVMIARKHYRRATVTYAASDLVRGVLFILPAVLTHSIRWLMIGALLFTALRVATLLWYVRSEFAGSLGIDPGLLKKQFSYTIPFSLAVLVEVIQANYHQYAVSYYFDAATFAIYSVGCLQIPIVDFIASPASNVMMVRMGEELREGRRSRVLPIWHDTSRKLSLVFFPLAGMLFVNATGVITLLFPPQYIASVPIFMVWTLTILFAVFQTDGVLRVFAETRYLVVMNIARLAAIIALMHWSITAFNLVGPVIVTIVGMSVARALALLKIQKLMNVPLTRLMPWRNLGGIAMAAMIAAIPAAFLSARLAMHSIVVLPLSGMVYMAVYAALLLCLRLLSAGEKRAIAESAAGFARRVRKAAA